jgi:hypothetical protein
MMLKGAIGRQKPGIKSFTEQPVEFVEGVIVEKSRHGRRVDVEFWVVVQCKRGSLYIVETMCRTDLHWDSKQGVDRTF